MNESPPSKSRWWRESKTLKLGAITTLISVLGLVAGEEWMQAYPEAVSALGLVTGFLIVLMRFLTKQPLGRREPVDSERNPWP